MEVNFRTWYTQCHGCAQRNCDLQSGGSGNFQFLQPLEKQSMELELTLLPTYNCTFLLFIYSHEAQHQTNQERALPLLVASRNPQTLFSFPFHFFSWLDFSLSLTWWGYKIPAWAVII
ncbi:hypothetical protein Dimus_018610 [Dionaea muscipula]